MTESVSALLRKPARPPLPEWTLEVVESFMVAPRMRRVVLTGVALAGFKYGPGQALALVLPLGDGQTGRRDYTIRSFDPARLHLAIDFFLHGDTPGPRWALATKGGETIIARGPRGRVVADPEADWHLLVGDETCLPAIAHIAEALPAASEAIAIIEVAGRIDEMPVVSPARLDLRWLHRNGVQAIDSDLVDRQLGELVLPEGHGRICLIGETGHVRRQRRALIARGVPAASIAAEGYWRPGRVGGHDHVDDERTA